MRLGGQIPQRLRRRGLPWVGGGAALLLFAAPLLGLSPYDTFFLATIGIAVILATSLNLAWGFTGLVSLAHTGLYAVGAYTSGVLAVKAGVSFWLGLPCALLAGALVGAVMAFASLRASSLYFAMITFAFDLILVEIAYLWEPVTGGQIGTFGIPPPLIGAYVFDLRAYYYLVWLFVALVLVLVGFIVHSRYGRAFISVRDAPDAAAALGVPPFRMKLLSFTISAALAALAGSLFGHLNGFIDPSAAGLTSSLNLFVANLFGGVGTLFGPVLGSGAVAEVQRLIQPWATYQALIFGIILLVAISVLPAGIVGTWRKTPWGRPDLSPPSPEAVREALAEAPPTPVAAASRDGASPSLLEARGIQKAFQGVRALQGVDLTIRPGTIHGLIGPNGSGKSTLVNLISGYLPRDAGAIRFAGRELGRYRAHEAAAAGLVRVFQIPHLFGNLTVLENMLIGLHLVAREGLLGACLRLPGFRREERRLRRRALRLLAEIGLIEKAYWSANTLPHGQQRLLEVARAIGSGPRLLVLDEPATGLTAEELDRLGQVIQQVRAAGVTVLLIEHNMGFVMSLCDQITVLENGEVIAEGPPAAIQRDSRVIEAYLGTPVASV